MTPENRAKMPYKSSEKKRDYQREYMRQRRAGVRPFANPEPEPVNPHQEQAQEPSRFVDRSRPYAIEGRCPYPAYLVQDGYWFHWDTGELVGEVRR